MVVTVEVARAGPRAVAPAVAGVASRSIPGTRPGRWGSSRLRDRDLRSWHAPGKRTGSAPRAAAAKVAKRAEVTRARAAAGRAVASATAAVAVGTVATGAAAVVVERARAAEGRAMASATAAVAVETVATVGTVEMEAAIALVHWAGLASRMKFHRKSLAAARARQPNGTAQTAFRPRTRARYCGGGVLARCAALLLISDQGKPGDPGHRSIGRVSCRSYLYRLYLQIAVHEYLLSRVGFLKTHESALSKRDGISVAEFIPSAFFLPRYLLTGGRRRRNPPPYLLDSCCTSP